MNKVKLYGGLVIALLLLNFGLVGFFFYNQKSEPEFKKPKEHIITKLEFTNEQIVEYESTIEAHKSAVNNKEKEISKLRNDLFHCLKNDEHEKANNIRKKFGRAHEEMEQIHYNHFMKIKSICKEDQLDEFDELLDEISGMFRGGKPPHHPPNGPHPPKHH